jgi:hypothetical protein
MLFEGGEKECWCPGPEQPQQRAKDKRWWKCKERRKGKVQKARLAKKGEAEAAKKAS